MKARTLLTLALFLSMSIVVSADPIELQKKAYRARLGALKGTLSRTTNVSTILTNAGEYTDNRIALLAIEPAAAAEFPEFQYESTLNTALASKELADVKAAVSFLHNQEQLNQSRYVPSTAVWGNFLKITRSTRPDLKSTVVSALSGWTSLPKGAETPFQEWSTYSLRNGGSRTGKDLATERLKTLGPSNPALLSNVILTGMDQTNDAGLRESLFRLSSEAWPPSPELAKRVFDLQASNRPNPIAFDIVNHWNTRAQEPGPASSAWNQFVASESPWLMTQDIPLYVKGRVLDLLQRQPELFQAELRGMLVSSKQSERDMALEKMGRIPFNKMDPQTMRSYQAELRRRIESSDSERKADAHRRAGQLPGADPETVSTVMNSLQSGDSSQAFSTLQNWAGRNAVDPRQIVLTAQKILLDPESFSGEMRQNAANTLVLFSKFHQGDIWSTAIADKDPKVAALALEELKQLPSVNSYTINQLKKTAESGSKLAMEALEGFAVRSVPGALEALESLTSHHQMGDYAREKLSQYSYDSKRVNLAKDLGKVTGSTADKIATELKTQTPSPKVLESVMGLLESPTHQQYATDILKTWAQNDESGVTSQRIWRRFMPQLESSRGNTSRQTRLTQQIHDINPSNAPSANWAVVLQNTQSPQVAALAASRLKGSAPSDAIRSQVESILASPRDPRSSSALEIARGWNGQGKGLSPESLLPMLEAAITSNDVEQQKLAGSIFRMVDFNSLQGPTLEKYLELTGWALVLKLDRGTLDIAKEKIQALQIRDGRVVFPYSLVNLLVAEADNSFEVRKLLETMAKKNPQVAESIRGEVSRRIATLRDSGLSPKSLQEKALVEAHLDAKDPLYLWYQTRSLNVKETRQSGFTRLTGMIRKNEVDSNALKDQLMNEAESPKTSTEAKALALRLVNEASPRWSDITRAQKLFSEVPGLAAQVSDPGLFPTGKPLVPGRFSPIAMTAYSPFWGGMAAKASLAVGNICRIVQNAASSILEGQRHVPVEAWGYLR